MTTKPPNRMNARSPGGVTPPKNGYVVLELPDDFPQSLPYLELVTQHLVGVIVSACPPSDEMVRVIASWVSPRQSLAGDMARHFAETDRKQPRRVVSLDELYGDEGGPTH